MMIFLAVWRYSDRRQPTTWLLLVALVLFAVADSLVAFLPFSHLIVGLGVSLLAYLVLCVINLWRLIFAFAKGAARRINWGLLLATFMGNAIMVYSILHSVLPRVCCCTYGADDERDSGSSDRLSAAVECGQLQWDNTCCLGVGPCTAALW